MTLEADEALRQMANFVVIKRMNDYGKNIA